MRFNPKYKINKVAGEYILLDTTVDSVNMNKVFAMNEPAAWLWKKIGESEFDMPDCVQLVCDEYEVNRDVAEHDVENMIRLWREYNILL